MTSQQREDIREALDFVNGMLERSTDPEEIGRLTESREHLEQLLKTKITGTRRRPMTVEALTNDRAVTAEEKLYEDITLPESRTLENFYERHESVRAAVRFPEEYTDSPIWEIKTFQYSERPGFDHCKWHVTVDAIDAEKLTEAIRKYTHVSGTASYPFVETTRASSPDTAVRLPWSDQTYSKIDIILSPYEHFVFQHTNLSHKDENGVLIEPKDTIFLETRVRPVEGYEELGNFRSYSAEEMQTVIYTACDSLNEKFGIRICKNDIKATYVEIAMTLCVFDSFDSLRVLEYFQQYIGRPYKPSTHMHTVEKEIIADRHDLTQTSGKMTMQCLDGLTARCGSRSIDVYDKGYETQCRLRESHGGTIKFLNDVTDDGFCESYARIEFSVAKKNPLNDCFYFDEPNHLRSQRLSPLLSDLTQDRLEGAYTHMVKKYLGDTYQAYAKDADSQLETMVCAANPAYNRSWKTDFLRSVYLYDQASHGLPIVLRNSDIDHLVSENPSFAKHPGRYRDILHDLLSHGNRFSVSAPYRTLGEIFDKTMRLQHIRTDRTVSYAFTNKTL